MSINKYIHLYNHCYNQDIEYFHYPIPQIFWFSFATNPPIKASGKN